MSAVGELIIESIKFINLCQQMFLEGKLDLESYVNLTNVKIGFLDQVISTEKRFYIPKYYFKCVKELYSIDLYISTLDREIVGKY